MSGPELPAETAAERPWFAEWFDHDYLMVYSHRDARDASGGVDLLERTLRPAPGARILDLACGPGRHLVHLAERGFRPIGLDLSGTLLAEAARVTAGLVPGVGVEGPRVALVRADMRAVPFPAAAFDVVASFFTSFGYFDDAGNRAVLAEMARLLRPGGGLFLDYVNREQVIAHLAPEVRRSLGSTFVLESRRFDADSGRLVKRIEIQDGSRTRQRVESVRLYDPEELAAMVAAAGIAVSGRYGDLDGQEFSPARSPRLVLTGRKP